MRPLTDAELERLRRDLRRALGERTSAAADPLRAGLARARPFPHASRAPRSGAIVGIDGSAYPLLVEEGRAVIVVCVAAARFDARAGVAGLASRGCELSLGLHVVGDTDRPHPLAGAEALFDEAEIAEALQRNTGALPPASDVDGWCGWIRRTAEWAAAAAVSGAALVLVDSRFPPPGGPDGVRAAARALRRFAARRVEDRGGRLLAVSRWTGIRAENAFESQLPATLGEPWYARLRDPEEDVRAVLAAFHCRRLRLEWIAATCADSRWGDLAECLTALDHASHADAAPSYPLPLREAHVACTLDRAARAAIAREAKAVLRERGIDDRALLDAGIRSGHAPSRGSGTA
ncbi:MAG TPA: hypothetical protein VKE69_08045 [Planctomycetota bacterium]|nr:hypothetical protein [Planctomycetota bacterium]